MGQKWTEEQRTKFKATMKAHYAKKREQAARRAKQAKKRGIRYKGNGLEQRHDDLRRKAEGGRLSHRWQLRKNGIDPDALPVVELSNGHSEAQEFAAFMAAAWKVYKGQ